MSEPLAWAAGFFDGEGCSSPSVQGKYCYLSVSIGQKDREVLDKFFEAVENLGWVYGPYGKVNGAPGMYRYQASGKEGRKVLELIWPWLGTLKRDQANRVLDKCQMSAI